MAGPLDGVRILDCTEIIAAPYAAALLSDMGAEVIKIEPVPGEAWRLQAQFQPLESRGFLAINRGKKDLTLNLRDSRGQRVLHDLARDADVFLTNYRPDTPARLGADYETLSKVNPRLIYVWNTAFGRKGPHANRPGYDIIIQAYSGIMTSLGGERDGIPTTMATAIADFSSALVLAWAVCAALYARERTGKGQLVDTSLLATALTMQPNRFFAITGLDQEKREDMRDTIAGARRESHSYPELHEVVSLARLAELQNRSPAANIYYRTYQAADGYVAVGCLSAALRAKFCQALDIHDPRYSDPALAPTTEKGREIGRQLALIVGEKFLDRTVDQWLEHLDRCGVPSGPVLFSEELWDDEQVKANDLLVRLQHETLGEIEMVGPAMQMSETPLEARSAPPVLGADTDAILCALGYGPDEIATLRADAVIR